MSEKIKNGITELVFILDRSGSMSGLESDTIGGFNAMIERQKEKYGWEFLFIGANIDAVETAAQYGISKDRAVNYVPDPTGTHILYESVSAVVGNVRANKCVDKDWSEELNKDYIRRVKNNR